MRFICFAFAASICLTSFKVQAGCSGSLEIKQSLAKLLLYVPARGHEVIAEVWNGFDRVELKVPLSQFLTPNSEWKFSVEETHYILVTWNQRTQEVRAAQLPTETEGPAMITRNMANSRLWFETQSGLGLVASPDKIANYRGEFLKEELNVDVGDHVWLRWNPETSKVEAVYL
jgi:hypothetical protein